MADKYNNANIEEVVHPAVKQVEATHEQSEKRYSKDLVDKKRPAPLRTQIDVSGRWASGTFGGHLTPFGIYEYLAGSNIRSSRVSFNLKAQPLAHVLFDKLQLNLYAVYVPNTRVWDDAEKFVSQKVDPFASPVTNVPTYVMAPSAAVVQGNGWSRILYQTSLWRETLAYHYYGVGMVTSIKPWNALPLRGYKAAWNDIFRDKTTQAPVIEYRDTVVTAAERNEVFYFGQPPSSTIPFDVETQPFNLRRVVRGKNYYTDWRPTVYSNNNPVDNTDLYSHVVTQQQVDEWRQRAENVDLTDEQVIAKIRGARVANQNMCYIIGSRTVDLDMALLPNNSEGVLQLGADGAISYTVGTEQLISSSFSAPLDGYIHYFYSLTLPASGIWAQTEPFELWKTHVDDFARPGFQKIKDAPMFSREIDGTPDSAVGWKRRYSDYVERLPSLIRGDVPIFSDADEAWNDSRQHLRGWYIENINGDSARLPSTATWHGLMRREDRENINPQNNKVDYSDYLLRRLLLVDFGTVPNRLFHRMSPYAIQMFGSYDLQGDIPLDPAIKPNFIAFGEE